MTVSSTAIRVSYAGNEVTTAFSYPYYFLSSDDLKVYTHSNGTETLLVLGSDYTVSGAGNGGGGTVTMLTAPAAGVTLLIYRDPAITQTTDYVDGDPFGATTSETALDKRTMVEQRLNDLSSRSLKLHETDTIGTGTYNAGAQRITNASAGLIAGDLVTLDQVTSLTAQTVLNLFATRVIAAAATISAATTWLRTQGYTTVGDGGDALYKKVLVSTSGGFQSADGAWWMVIPAFGAVNVLQFGARNDNSVNAGPGIQLAVNYVANELPNATGKIVFPGGTYQIGTTVIIPANTFLHLEGSGSQEGTILYATADVSILITEVGTARTIIEKLAFNGWGTLGGPPTPFNSGVNPAVYLLGDSPRIENCKFFGGAPPLQIDGVEPIIFMSEIGGYSYAGSLLSLAAGGWVKRVSLDQNFPATPLAVGTAINAWTNGHVYATGEFALIGDYVVQATIGGISGGSAPALKNYGNNIIDNAVTWQLAFFNDQSGIHMVGTCQEVHIEQTDNTFPIKVESSGFNFYITDSTTSGVIMLSGQGLYFSHNELSTTWSMGASAQGILFDPGFVGEASVIDNEMTNCISYGVLIKTGAGANIRVTNNTIKGSTVAAVKVEAGVNSFIVTDNFIQSSAGGSVIIDAGASDNYIVSNNLINGVAVVDGGTGLNKLVDRNI